MSGKNLVFQLTAPDKQTNKQNGQILNKTEYIHKKIELFLFLSAVIRLCSELNTGHYSLPPYGRVRLGKKTLFCNL